MHVRTGLIAALLLVVGLQSAAAEDFGPFRYRIGDGIMVEIGIADDERASSILLCVEWNGILKVPRKCDRVTPKKVERSGARVRLHLANIYELDRRQKVLTVHAGPDTADTVVVRQGRVPWIDTPVYRNNAR